MKTNVIFQRMSFLILLLCMVMLNTLHAQQKIGVSVQAGPSSVDLNGLGELDLLDPYIRSIPQYSAGLDYQWGINEHWAIVTGAHYASRGFGMREDINVNVFGLDLPLGASVATRLNYIEVPLAVQYNFMDGGVSPYIKAGVSSAYAVKGTIQPKIDAIISWKLPAININLQNDLYNRLDLSGVVGAGINIPTNDIGSIQLEMNYRHSLNDMFLDKITDIRIKSNGFSAGIGYTMRF